MTKRPVTGPFYHADNSRQSSGDMSVWKEGNMIKAGQKFILSTASYSDREEITVTALQDITEQDFAVMRDKFKTHNETAVWRTLGYDHIGAYLFLCGFINEPEFLPMLDCGYSIDISEEDFRKDIYGLEIWKEQVNQVKRAGII